MLFSASQETMKDIEILFKNVNTEVSAAGKVTQFVKSTFGLSVCLRNTSEEVQHVAQMLHGVLSAPMLTAWPPPARSQP